MADAGDSHDGAPLMCIECEDTPVALECHQCQDKYCELCYQAQHKRGNRAKHTTTRLIETHQDVAVPTSSAAESPQEVGSLNLFND